MLYFVTLAFLHIIVGQNSVRNCAPSSATTAGHFGYESAIAPKFNAVCPYFSRSSLEVGAKDVWFIQSVGPIFRAFYSCRTQPIMASLSSCPVVWLYSVAETRPVRPDLVDTVEPTYVYQHCLVVPCRSHND
jgi:hypothetical protein